MRRQVPGCKLWRIRHWDEDNELLAEFLIPGPNKILAKLGHRQRHGHVMKSVRMTTQVVTYDTPGVRELEKVGGVWFFTDKYFEEVL